MCPKYTKKIGRGVPDPKGLPDIPRILRSGHTHDKDDPVI